MRTRRRLDPGFLILLALAAGTAALLLAAGDGGTRAATPARPAAGWKGLVGGPRPEIGLGQRMLVVLKGPSLADQLAKAGGVATESQERAWTAAALASQVHLLAFLSANGIYVRPEFRYARVLNGFSAPLDPRAIGLLERSADVAGVFAVRAAYPAALAPSLLRDRRFALGGGRRADIELPGYDGRGVTIALLDTGVDRDHEYLLGSVEPGFDVVGRDRDARPGRSPENKDLVERHGTELAGLLVGHGGPAQLAGAAPGATVLPIRVAGWQSDARRRFAVYARTDQLIAGLERAVDPNEDGDAHDAVRVALVGLSVPFAAFADTPEARAVDGATRLDTLVVVAAGNDGVAGPAFGAIAGPGGAASALTVGAVDARLEHQTVRIVLRRGLDVLLDRESPLLDAVAPRRATTLRPASPRMLPRPGGVAFLDRHGYSLVVRRAAVVAAGDDPAGRARAAVRAGAAAVLLYGDRLPPGGLGLDERLRVPVVSIPAGPALALLAAAGAGADVGVTIGSARGSENPGAGGVAPFSSRGLSFDSRVKPELVAPGVELATSEPGGGYGTVSGTSAAAATVAGAAALLAESRPSLGAAALAGLLVGSSRRLGSSTPAQGAGLVDVGAAAAGEVASSPAALGFGARTGKRWASRQTIVVRNVSTRRLRVTVKAVAEGGEPELLALTVEPRRFVVRQGHAQTVTVTMRLAARPTLSFATGSLVVAPEGGRPLRVPWAVGLRKPPGRLLAGARLSRTTFRPSEGATTVLSFRAGTVVVEAGVPQLAPVARLDVRLIRGDGRWLGVIARLRDTLPGRFAFGITGRDPQGTRLPPGTYRLQLVAWPTVPGPPTRVSLPFSIG